jgi:hypothetical protein
MTQQEFHNLNLRQKGDVLWEWGYYLGSRKTDTNTVALFLINDFFCEVFLSDSKTEDIQVVSSGQLHSDFMRLLDRNNPLTKLALSKI